jgi:hypothetical protein
MLNNGKSSKRVGWTYRNRYHRRYVENLCLTMMMPDALKFMLDLSSTDVILQ